MLSVSIASINAMDISFRIDINQSYVKKKFIYGTGEVYTPESSPSRDCPHACRIEQICLLRA